MFCLKPINGFDGLYSVTEDGRVWSHRNSKFLSQYFHNYWLVHLYKNGRTYNCLTHRLVAETYLPNHKNLPQVDHIDNNPRNNHVTNLQWITVADNIHKTYAKLSQVRNFRKCCLFKNGKLIGIFKSINECSRECRDKYNLSYTGMIKYKRKKDYVIKGVTTSKYCVGRKMSYLSKCGESKLRKAI